MNEHLALLRRCKVSWIYPIYVPSYSRAGGAPLLDILAKAPESVQRRVHVMVRRNEQAAYREAYPWARIVSERGMGEGVGNARAAILRNAELHGYSRIVMMDDDVVHLSLMEKTIKEDGRSHTRRWSEKLAGQPTEAHLPRSLAVACYLADRVFEQAPAAAYGSGRQGLFSGDVDTDIGAFADKGGFPACVLFFDLKRFTWRDCPEPYRLHGEDLSMFLHTLSEGSQAFVIPSVAYDTKNGIESTIPLDPLDERGREDDLEAAFEIYPKVAQYLRPTMRNKNGGIMKIGVHWPQWYKDTKFAPYIIPMQDLIN
ncbi:glycosyltransferase [Microbacterium phage CaptainRex]|nr:glycosyltransferase [Microbacterium phage Hasitha]WIC89876.1 glycosyltransferase [Microbacterium phage CaptainRex]